MHKRPFNGESATLDYRTVLSTNYIPATLRHRDQQLQQLQEDMTQQRPQGYYCEGAKSTGKTVTALKFIESLNNQPNHVGVYLRTERSILIDFKDALSKTLNRTLKWREHPLFLFGEFKQRHIHIFIDDAQKIMHFRMFNDFLHSLHERCVENNKTLHLKILGTTAYPIFKHHVRDDVESRFQFKPLIFPFYNAVEIGQILKQRLDLCNIKYEEAAINFTAAKIATLVADLRLGFQILENACSLLNGDQITDSLIQQAWDKTKTDYWTTSLKELDTHSRLLILAATKLAKHQGFNISTIDVNNLYRQICYTMGLEPLYAQRTYYLLSKLIPSGWFTRMETMSRGRKGKGALLRYEMTPETIMKALEQLFGGNV